jgi:hypothetical protein
MNDCESITIEITPAGPVFRGAEWPLEIEVDRSLLEYPQGPHVQFGRRGSLQFFAVNGSAAYRRTADVAGGWRYVRTDSKLEGARPAAATAKPGAPHSPVAAKQFKDKSGAVVEAFQWLPHAVPPVALPDWFMRADFEHNKDGNLILRTRNGIAKAEPSDWVVRAGDKIVTVKSAAFQGYVAV